MKNKNFNHFFFPFFSAPVEMTVVLRAAELEDVPQITYCETHFSRTQSTYITCPPPPPTHTPFCPHAAYHLGFTQLHAALLYYFDFVSSTQGDIQLLRHEDCCDL